MLVKGKSKPYGPLRLMSNVNFYRNVYLHSDHWKNLRSEKLSKNPSCEKCGCTLSIQVHHLKYRGLYDVTLKDLKTLCQLCHEKEHIRLSKTKERKKLKSFTPRSRKIERDNKYWSELRYIKKKMKHQRGFLTPKNRQRQMEFDKKYPTLPYELNNYVSIHY